MEQPIQIHTESRSSIELQRAKDGTYHWTAKVYCAPGHEEEALAQARAIDRKLRRAYVWSRRKAR
jgi:hypothetical protein